MKLSEHLTAASLIESPVEAVAAHLQARFATYGEVRRASVEGWRAALDFLLPLLSMDKRYLLVPFETWTLIVDNCGWGVPTAQTAYLNAGTRCVGVNAVWRERGRTWEVWEHGERKRAVVCYEDGHRWVFHQEGAILPFEDESHYVQRKKSDRFPAKVLQAYVQSMTGLHFPIDWRAILSAPSTGLERSTSRVRVPIKEYAVDVDL